MDGSQFLLKCTDLNITQLKIINTSRSVAGSVCTVMICSVLVFTLYKKAFSTVLQRLFIYLVIATIIQEALIAVSFEHQFVYPGQDELCTAYGFIIQWSGVVMFNFALGIMFYLLYLVYVKIQGHPCGGLTQSNKLRKAVEVTYILFIILFPLSYLWVPFLHDNYGLSGASCWMRALDENCTNVGLIDQLVFAYGAYEGVGLASIVVTITISIVYCRVARIYADARKLIRRTMCLTGFLFIYVVLISIPLAVRMLAGISGSRQHFILWITWAIAIPISHTIFIYGFLFSFYTIKVCNFQKMNNVIQSCCCRTKENFTRQKTIATVDENTIPPSDRVSMPSNTYFSVPYTGGFTDVEKSEAQPLVPARDKDTGYSSVTDVL